MINGQSGAFEAFKNWWDHEDQEELRRSCAQGWAWKVWQARAALDSEQQPDVTQLVDALERIMTWPDGGNRYGQANIKVFAAEALAKYQPCGCVICTCEHETQCQGCGAKHCGTHPVGQIHGPVYQQPVPDVAELVDALERVMYCNEVGFLPEDVQQAVSDALAAHRRETKA